MKTKIVTCDGCSSLVQGRGVEIKVSYAVGGAPVEGFLWNQRMPDVLESRSFDLCGECWAKMAATVPKVLERWEAAFPESTVKR